MYYLVVPRKEKKQDKEIEKKLEQLKKDKESGDIGKIKTSLDALNESFQKISQQMYQQAQDTEASKNTTSQDDSNDNTTSSEEAKDADYEVIDDDKK